MPGTGSIESPSRRARSDPYPRLINRPDRSSPIGPNHTVPYGTVRLFARMPGNKLPGYDHSVPPGRILSRAYSRQSGCHGMPGLRRAQSSRYYHSVPTGQIRQPPWLFSSALRGVRKSRIRHRPRNLSRRRLCEGGSQAAPPGLYASMMTFSAWFCAALPKVRYASRISANLK